MSSALPNEKNIVRRRLKLDDLPRRPNSNNPDFNLKVDHLRNAILADLPDIIREMSTDEKFLKYMTAIYFNNASRNAPIAQYLLQCGLAFDLVTENLGSIDDILNSAVEHVCYTLITAILEKGYFLRLHFNLSVKLVAMIMKMPTCRHMMRLLGNVSQECLDKSLEIPVTNISKMATDRLLRYGATPNIRCFKTALRLRPSFIWRLIKNTKFIHQGTVEDLTSFMKGLFRSPLWSPKGTRAKKEINVYRLPPPATEYKWMPSKERWLRYNRRERMRIVCRIKLDFVLRTDEAKAVEEILLNWYGRDIPEDLIKECLHYVIYHDSTITAALYLKQVGIPRDIRRLIIKRTYPQVDIGAEH